MPFKNLFWPLTAFACLALAAGAGCQTPPAMDKDPIGYLHFLETSTDPPAIALRQQIQNGPADLAKARAAALQDGIPLKPAGLQKPLPPEGQNAAPLYQELAQRLHEDPLNLPPYAQPLKAGYAYTPEQLAAVQKIHDSRPDIWNLAHDAADKPQCVFSRDWKLGPAVLFPEYATLREAERLISTETYLLAAQGKYKDAVQNQTRGFRIAEQTGSDPILISYLVGLACDAVALRGMQDILTLAGPNAALDAEVQKAVADNRPRLSLRYALGGEAASQAVSYHWIHDGLPQADLTVLAQVLAPPEKPAPVIAGAPATPTDRAFALCLLDFSHAKTLDGLRQMAVASDLPPQQRREVFARYAGLPEGPPKTLTILEGILPVLAKVEQNDTRRQAQEAVTLAGAAVLGAGTPNSAFPAALPGTWADPFTGQPLGYRREGSGGFVVYSAGADGIFDGGKPGEKTPSGQVLFRYPVKPLPLTPDMLK